jgi:hypothetical protein
MGAVGGGLTMTIGQSGNLVSAHVVPGIMEEMTTEGKSLEQAPVRMSLGALVSTPTKGGALGVKAGALGSFACVVDKDDNPRFKAYVAEQLGNQGKNYSFSWTFFRYSVDNARRVYTTSGSFYESFQLETCFVGGGTSSNWWHQWYQGASATATRQRIGYSWGKGETSSGSVSTSLSFSVSAGPVTIGASTSISPGKGTLAGSTGKDANAYEYPYSSALDNNRVNATWTSPDNDDYDGTGQYIGNIGNALWEMPEASKTAVIDAWASARYFCARPFSSSVLGDLRTACPTL